MATAHTVPLIIAQYLTVGHKKGPDVRHQALVALYSKQKSYVFEVRGNEDTFEYCHQSINALNRSMTYCGGYQVGDIPIDKINWLKEELSNIKVVRHDENWDCRNWIMDVLRHLKELGVINGDVGVAHIKAALMLDEEYWNSGEDTVDERLFRG